MVAYEDTPLISRSDQIAGCMTTNIDMQMWLHCNGCYFRPEGGSNLRFYITSCSHIFCEKCVDAYTKEGCRICRSSCTTLLLGGKLNKEVEALFTDPLIMLKKATQQVCQTTEFQRSHQRRWIKRLSGMVRTFETQIGEVKKIAARAQAIERELLKVKKENEYLKMVLSKKDARGAGFRAGYSPGYKASPNYQSPVHQFMSGCPGSVEHCSNILNQPGRLLMRTPPSGGHLGTVGSVSGTPGSHSRLMSKTPLSIPRPINLNDNEDGEKHSSLFCK